MVAKRVLVINGANMDLLGKRDATALGNDTLESIMGEFVDYATKLGVEAVTYQSNSESDIINLMHEAMHTFDGIIINPGSFGHYSIGLKEAIDAFQIPCTEVHLANFFRKPENKSVIASVCRGLVCGYGKESYKVALDGLVKIM
jgi:3-dehydroquinate dehydratase-2